MTDDDEERDRLAASYAREIEESDGEVIAVGIEHDATELLKRDFPKPKGRVAVVSPVTPFESLTQAIENALQPIIARTFGGSGFVKVDIEHRSGMSDPTELVIRLRFGR